MEIFSGLTTSIDKLFEAFLTEMLWFFIFSSGIMAILLTKFKNEIDRKVTGIARIHRKGKDVRNLLRALNNSQEICILGFVPYGFVFDNRELLTKKIKDGCKINVLFCQYNSSVLQELSQIDNGTDVDIANKIEPMLNLLNRIKKDAGSDSRGIFEIRTCDSEIRNPVIICYQNNNKTSAFLTISLPPKRSIDTPMIEFRNEKCDNLINYFYSIWNRHADRKFEIR